MDMVELGWSELRNRCCADPDSAKRCVMVSRDDFVAAIRAMLEGLEPVAYISEAGERLPVYDLSALKEVV